MSRIRAPTVSAETLQLGLRPIKAQESSTTGAIIAHPTRLMSSNAKSRVGLARMSFALDHWERLLDWIRSSTQLPLFLQFGNVIAPHLGISSPSHEIFGPPVPPKKRCSSFACRSQPTLFVIAPSSTSHCVFRVGGVLIFGSSAACRKTSALSRIWRQHTSVIQPE
ncbi:predicted protein [Coccidioides posadasii str. Silveira]|uniref:Predicted protein n=1 Tax=Coccidioides posadasii (strain RMSCC 757 / Silveira) TaxID=443226 RepID=E9DAB4_COCPS|nr:predicted protein [Coccidioides posadasii str. Silveira]